MDLCDAPINNGVKSSIECSDIPLEVVTNEACRLFEEFLRLDEPLIRHWEDDLRPPLTAKERADSPVQPVLLLKSASRSIEQNESLLDDNCEPDCQVLKRPAAAVVRETGAKPEKVVNEKTRELANELARAGDDLFQQYEGRVMEVGSKLLQLVTTEEANLTYERFSRAADDLLGKDKNWTNFIFATQVAKRLCKHSKQAFTYGKAHFERYVSTFAPAMQQSGGVENFVKQRGN